LKLKSLIWVVEISHPELLPTNHRKLGEIVLRADLEIPENQSEKMEFFVNFSNFVFARMPGYFYFLNDIKRTPLGNPKHVFETYCSGIDDHVELLKI